MDAPAPEIVKETPRGTWRLVMDSGTQGRAQCDSFKAYGVTYDGRVRVMLTSEGWRVLETPNQPRYHSVKLYRRPHFGEGTEAARNLAAAEALSLFTDWQKERPTLAAEGALHDADDDYAVALSEVDRAKAELDRLTAEAREAFKVREAAQKALDDLDTEAPQQLPEAPTDRGEIATE